MVTNGVGAPSGATANHEGITLFLGSVALGTLYYYFFPNMPWLPGIPIQEANSILGYTKLTNEQATQKMLREKGPLVQYKAFGRNLLFIADKKLAKTVLRDVTGKGFFHNSTPKLTTSSTFSFDTGPEWSRRRSAFRKAFSTNCLKAHMSTITQLSGRMGRYLQRFADQNEVVSIDDVFLQLTIGVICEVAFEMNVNAFEDSSDYGKHMDGVLKELFKVILFIIFPFL
jgi:cytochrome P450